MRLTAWTPRSPATQSGDHLPDSDVSASQTTRYLMAAAHLRRPMLPHEITELGLPAARPPLPVGRTYARRVLFSVERVIPMSAVNDREVRRHCRIALLQTIVRDVAAIAALATSAVLEPWSTAVTLSLVAAVIILAGRVRLFSPLVIAAAVGATLALVAGNPRERISLATPLICLAIFLSVYLADILLSIHHVRRIWRKAAKQREPYPANPDLTPEPATKAGWPYTSTDMYGSHQVDFGEQDNGGVRLPGSGDRRRAPSVSEPKRVYHDKYGIIGAGTAMAPLTLTVPLDKALDITSEMKTFSTSELTAYIGTHLLSQGTGDTNAHGFAYKPLAGESREQDLQDSGHFTYGLPYLEVGTVVAAPLPKARKIPALPVSLLSLNYHDQPSKDEILGVADRSPSEHPERYYIRVSTSSWDGQLVASAYLNAGLQGHYLRVIIRPYVLAPIVTDLKVADELATRHPLILTCLAVTMTVRQFRTAAERLHTLKIRSENTGKADAARPGLRSTRERYAQLYTENMHQAEDSRRIIEVLEYKIIKVTMDYLRNCNIDIEEYERRVLNIVQNNTIMGDGNITAGSFTNSQVTNVSGRGNTATNTANGKT